MNIDWNACAHFKGTNQKPLWLVEGRGLFRPTIQRIASYIAKNTDLDAVVLRSHSHPNGDDLRWYDYLNAMKSNPFFSTGEYGCVKYKGKDKNHYGEPPHSKLLPAGKSAYGRSGASDDGIKSNS